MAFFGLFFAGAVGVPTALRGPARCVPQVHTGATLATLPAAHDQQDIATLKVMSLNLAHGRKTGSHQFLLDQQAIRTNLKSVASVLEREGPHLVAVQEADAPSIWSGNFHHVRYLAESSGLSHFVHGRHVEGLSLCYGTALLSQLEMTNPVSRAFAPSPPTPCKGMVVSTINWPGSIDAEVDVVSVHLDFARASVRQKQVQTLVRELSKRKRPLIVLGDFNCRWNCRDSTLRELVAELDLQAYHPDAADLATFPTLGTRIDWILISPELEFVSYRSLPDVVSDHLPVMAELRWKE